MQMKQRPIWATFLIVFLVGLSLPIVHKGYTLQENGRVVGVAAGDWWILTVDFKWLTTPYSDPLLDFISNVQWTKITILDVFRTNVTIQLVCHLKNETETGREVWIDATTGHFDATTPYNVPPYVIIAANLSQGEAMYTEEFPYTYLTIYTTLPRTYLGTVMQANWLQFSAYGYNIEVYYAREKGILCEARLHSDTYSIHALITESSMIQAVSEFPSLLMLLLCVIATLVTVTLYKRIPTQHR
jgi:hypothetical protein